MAKPGRKKKPKTDPTDIELIDKDDIKKGAVVLKEYITISQLAKVVGVTQPTISGWLKSGKVSKVYEIPGKNGKFVHQSEVHRLLSEKLGITQSVSGSDTRTDEKPNEDDTSTLTHESEKSESVVDSVYESVLSELGLDPATAMRVDVQMILDAQRTIKLARENDIESGKLLDRAATLEMLQDIFEVQFTMLRELIEKWFPATKDPVEAKARLQEFEGVLDKVQGKLGREFPDGN